MTSTYSTNLKLNLMGTGDQSGTWGTTTNTNLGTLLEQAVVGYTTQTLTGAGPTAITIPDGATGVARNYILEFTGTPTAGHTVTVPASQKSYILFNNTNVSITVKVSGQTGVTIAVGKKALVYNNATDIIEVVNAPVGEATTQTLTNKTFGPTTFTGTATATTITSPAATNLTIQSAGTTAMTIDTSQNVGIGTSSPSYTLDVRATTGSIVATSNTGTNYAKLQCNNTGGSYQFGIDNSVGTNFGSGTAYARVIWNDSSTAPTILYTNSTERMRIDSSGSVGIGTTDYGSFNRGLSIYAAGGVYSGIQLTNSTTGNVNTAGTLIYTAGNDFLINNKQSGDITFYTANTERMRIDSSGNVGIGTTTPSTKLTVFSATNAGIAVNNGTVNTIIYNSTGGIASIGTTTNHPVDFYSNNAARMRIDSSGNMLVGGTSADAKFVVTNTTNTPTGRIYSSATSEYTSETFQVVAGQPSGTGFKVAAFYINNAAAYAAYIRGDGTIFAVSTTIQAISDERTKENIVSSNDGLNVISALRPVRFDFKEGFGNGKQNQLGFIAQEIEQVFPEAVDEWGESDDPDKPYKSVGFGALIPVLVKAIQELKTEFDAYKASHA